MSTHLQSANRSQHRYFINSRGKKLLARHWQSDQSVSNLLLLPGFSEHSARYQPVADQLCKAGCNVFALDYEGHGKSDGLKGDIREFSYYVDDVQQYLRALIEENEGPFWVMGHGMGALIAIQLAHRLKGKNILQAMVLSAPLFGFGAEVPRIVQDTAKYVSTMAATFPILTIEDGWLSEDQKALTDYNEDELNFHGKLRARIASHLIENGKKAFEQITKLDLPILILHSKADKFATPELVKELATDKNLPDNISVEWLKDRGHMLLFENGWQKLISKVVSWSDELCQVSTVATKVPE